MKINFEIHVVGLCAIAALVISGCKPPGETPPEKPPMPEVTRSQSNAVMKAMANLKPVQGSGVKGTVTFTQVDNGVRVVADITGLKEGEHGFHVHENGDCSAPDASSAGGHFNPTGMSHDGPDAEKQHIGDLGNITADASGKAHLDQVFSFLALSGTNSIVGRGFVVHAGKDDLTSQPSGDTGARVVCGVIELKNKHWLSDPAGEHGNRTEAS